MVSEDWSFLSIGARYLVNLHALNNEGTSGNLTRLRRVSYIVPDGNGSYKTLYVNVVSGQSIAHAIQAHIADLAMNKGLPVCRGCQHHAFIKHANKEYIEFEGEDFVNILKPSQKASGLEQQISLTKEAERKLLNSCVVEDVGGFLVAEKGYLNVRRESAFHVSFFAPTFDQATTNYIESMQFARHDPTQAAKETSESKASETEGRSAQGQMLFVQEVSGGIYGLRLDLDLKKVGRLAAVGIEDFDGSKREERLAVALEAIKRTVGYMQFGAKLSRFLPIQDLLDVVIVLSDGIPVSSPFRDDFVTKTKKRVETHAKLGGKAKLFHYDPNGTKDFEEVFHEVVNELGLKF